MKISIVGAAQIVSEYHIHALMAIEGVVVDSVIDLDEKIAKTLADTCGARASCSLDATNGADIVFIATPPSPRFNIIENLPTSTQRIVIEKPASLDLEEFDELSRLVRNRDIELSIAQTRRYFLNLRMCAELLISGLLGGVREIHFFEGGIINWRSNSSHLLNSESSKDKGILQDVGSHLFDWIGLLLPQIGINPDEIKLTSCSADFNTLSNKIDAYFQGPIKINSHISRERILSNSIKIVGELGILTTRSLIDDKIKIQNNHGDFFVKTSKNISEYSLESAFISMWKDLIYNEGSRVFYPTTESVRPGIIFMNEIVKKLS